MSLKGFRRGKIPRKVLERHVGRAAVAQEAANHAVSAGLADIIETKGIDMLGRPEISDISGGIDEPFSFSATIDIRPTIDVGELSELDVRLEETIIEPSDTDVDDQIDRLRARFAVAEPVSRSAEAGDTCLINLDASIHDDKVDEFTREEFSYEVGSKMLVDELDAELVGAKSGDILAFNATIPEASPIRGGEEIAFRVLVKEVQEKILPDVTDEWVQEASEFDTVAELREEVASGLRSMRLDAAQHEAQDAIIAAIAKRADLIAPASLVADEVDTRLGDLANQVSRAGMDFAEFLSSTDDTEEALRSRIEPAARKAVETMLVLTSVLDHEEISASPAEVDAEIAGLAERAEVSVAKLRRDLQKSGRLSSIVFGIVRTKAVLHLIDTVPVLDAIGESVGFGDESDEDAVAADAEMDGESAASDDLAEGEQADDESADEQT